jgi:hypothetical protein
MSTPLSLVLAALMTGNGVIIGLFITRIEKKFLALGLACKGLRAFTSISKKYFIPLDQDVKKLFAGPAHKSMHMLVNASIKGFSCAISTVCDRYLLFMLMIIIQTQILFVLMVCERLSMCPFRVVQYS